MKQLSFIHKVNRMAGELSETMDKLAVITEQLKELSEKVESLRGSDITGRDSVLKE